MKIFNSRTPIEEKHSKQNITLLGCGRWGSCIAWYLDSMGYSVASWGRENDPIVDDLFKDRKNEYVTYPDSIELTHDLEHAINRADIIIISIGAQQVRNLMQNVKKVEGYKTKTYVLCMKGIEESTGLRLSQVLHEHGIPKKNIAAWVGPGHIQEFTKGVPSLMVIDSTNKKLSEKLVKMFSSSLIKFYQGNDMIGTEIGAAAKNVMGVAAGLLDGSDHEVLKGPLMARGAYEVGKLIKAEGGKLISAFGLCHLGDYEATLFSKHSHNRGFGEKFIQGEKFEKLAEGVYTCGAMLKMAEKHHIYMPITKAVYDVVQKKENPQKVLDELLTRSNIKEFNY